jgi:nitrous oxidase accessory protein NosD
MAGAVQAQTLINTCPFVISSPGRYLLGSDLICSGGDGITILSSDVTLAFEGHRITFSEVGANLRAIVVNPGFSRPGPERVRILGPGLITNGGVNATGTGVTFNLVTNSEVSGLTMVGFGILAQSNTSGIPLEFLKITKNTIGQVTNGPGIGLFQVLSSTISENNVSGNNNGIAVFGPVGGLASQANMIHHNNCSGNASDGLSISVGPATVQNNVITGNGAGITVLGPPIFPPANNVQITNNTSLANQFDMTDIPGCTGTVWSGNTFFTANQSCIH